MYFFLLQKLHELDSKDLGEEQIKMMGQLRSAVCIEAGSISWFVLKKTMHVVQLQLTRNNDLHSYMI